MRFDLVFEGGGAKGMAFVGACAELFGADHKAGRLLGTSAGAITATLLAAGYTPEEMMDALGEQANGRSVFAGFMGDPTPFDDGAVEKSAIRALLRNIDVTFLPRFLEDGIDNRIARALARGERSKHLFALVERGGWFAADAFTRWLENKLDSGPWREGGERAFSSLTLKQFFAATGADLSLVASDTTAAKLLVLNHRTAPDCPVVAAVRMSMSIPLVWDEVIWKSAWGKYQGNEVADHVVVDGGMLSNFPIELFLSDEPQVTSVMGPKGSDDVLGVLIDETLAPPTMRGRLVRVDVDPTELAMVKRLKRLVDTMTGAHDNRVIEQHEDRIVRLPAKGYGTTEFDMPPERRDTLVAAARRAMREFLDRTEAAPSPRGDTRGMRRSAPPSASAQDAARSDRIAREILAY